MDAPHPLAIRFRTALFARFPTWRALATSSLDPGAGVGSLHIQIPCAGAEETGLWIDTDEEMDCITIGLGMWHGHWQMYEDTDELALVDSAMAFLEDLLTGRVVVAETWRGGRYAESRLVREGAELPAQLPGTEVRIRSCERGQDGERAG